MNKSIGVPTCHETMGYSAVVEVHPPTPKSMRLPKSMLLQTRIEQVNDAKRAREKVPIASRSHAEKRKQKEISTFRFSQCLVIWGMIFFRNLLGIVQCQDIQKVSFRFIGGLDFLGKSQGGKSSPTEMPAATYHKQL